MYSMIPPQTSLIIITNSSWTMPTESSKCNNFSRLYSTSSALQTLNKSYGITHLQFLQKPTSLPWCHVDQIPVMISRCIFNVYSEKQRQVQSLNGYQRCANIQLCRSCGTIGIPYSVSINPTHTGMDAPHSQLCQLYCSS